MSTGRPRNDEIVEVTYEAVLKILREEGPRAVTMARVARETGIGKPALYRRWKDRTDLTTEALVTHVGDTTPPSTEDTVRDLYTYLQALLTYGYSSPPAISGLPSLNSTIAPEYLSVINAIARPVIKTRLERYVSHIKNTEKIDVDLATDTVLGTVLYSTLIRRQSVEYHVFAELLRSVCCGTPTYQVSTTAPKPPAPLIYVSGEDDTTRNTQHRLPQLEEPLTLDALTQITHISRDPGTQEVSEVGQKYQWRLPIKRVASLIMQGTFAFYVYETEPVEVYVAISDDGKVYLATAADTEDRRCLEDLPEL